jgi:nucleoside diphosphate kinase
MTNSAGRYDRDTYYLETCDALAAAGIDRDAFARRHALLLLKPDAAITGAMRPAVSWLLDHGYRIVGAHPVQMTRLHVRALWYFNWHRATPERRRLADLLAELTPSVVLIVTHPDDTEPVSVRLTADKGPADPGEREPGQLRHALGAGTYLLNLVHTADHPDDVLRELSIYFPEPLLGEVVSACAADADASAEAASLVERIESGVDRRSGDLAAAQDALWDDLAASGMAERPQSGDEWLDALDAAERRGILLDPWFTMVVGSAYRPMHRRSP